LPRPKCSRNIGLMPEITCFRPEGVKASSREEVQLTLDEFEAVRLAHYEGMYHEQAAAMMNISRPTFGRIIESAQQKIADFLVNSKALRITGGDIFIIKEGMSPCGNCKRASVHCEGMNGGGRCPYCRRNIKKS